MGEAEIQKLLASFGQNTLNFEEFKVLVHSNMTSTDDVIVVSHAKKASTHAAASSDAAPVRARTEFSMHVPGSCYQTPEVGSSPAWMFELRAHRDGEAHAWTVVSRRICDRMSFHSSHLVHCSQRVSLRSVLSKFKSVFSGQ